LHRTSITTQNSNAQIPRRNPRSELRLVEHQARSSKARRRCVSRRRARLGYFLFQDQRHGINVYEQEASLFFKDLSSTVIPDDVIQRRVSVPNVIVTGHQAFFTREALGTILDTTLRSISDFAAGRPLAASA
jgi:hypothetical protein